MNLDDKIALLGDILQPDRDDTIYPQILARAVKHAYRRLSAQGENPADEKWLTDRDLFLLIARPLIAEFWCKLTGEAAEALPWSENALLHAWLERGYSALPCESV